jgi:nucleotide-binding universal stress UspA family protein
MSVPAVRRITVGVDGSAESFVALQWACREASLRGAQVHAVHVREAQCHSLASYAVPVTASPDDSSADSIEDLVRAVQADQAPSVEVLIEVVDGLAARILLDRCTGADMLVLGTASDTPGAGRPVGPVIRACLRRAPCPVVVIGAAQEPAQRREPADRADKDRGRVPAAAGV